MNSVVDYKKVDSYFLTEEQLQAERERLDALKPRDYKGQTEVFAPQKKWNGKYIRKGGEW
ncbi:hypothetical protein [Paenibacillus alvei]|uniref:hypothetical protein n=1 Tax=Paenibacillus alvei TaxID=44250 RepID=UPI0018CDCEFA|nr:hypothetical protein [Paenibacillus alvei]MBG9735781.1 hypothetical protein [Paenibacillus alvei]MBG9744360.1 hypothetical protein [Paenibacillus alvei]MCY9577903.1 hypothetical protein [Paenibacillus alvei]MCY9587330.1 hypothetical protein [Paenibacillus alvei]